MHDEEINYVHKNNLYDLVGLPKGKKVLRKKWMFKLKIKVVKNLVKY